MQTAIELCKILEPKLRGIKCHCAITGSRLYGMGKKHDIDIIIYRHNVPGGRGHAAQIIDEILVVLRETLGECQTLTDPNYDEVIKCKFFENSVDFLLL